MLATRTFLPLALVVACSSPASDAAIDASDGDARTAADAGAVDAPRPAGEPAIPTPTGPCPTIAAGDVTFAPAGIAPRRVRLTLANAPTPGPLVIYWHATNSAPTEAGYALGATASTITSGGGVIAAPYADPAAGQFEWFIVNQSPRLDDFIVADEIVGCLAAAHRIDPHHVHSMGMSAGALQTTALSFLRSSYVASVATYSGGMPAGFTPATQDATNLFAAMIFDGGTSDNVFGVDFKAASERYQATLAAAGHFAALCDHGGGHSIPLDAAPSVAQFFGAHGFGVSPSPYAAGLPASFPSYCDGSP